MLVEVVAFHLFEHVLDSVELIQRLVILLLLNLQTPKLVLNKPSSYILQQL